MLDEVENGAAPARVLFLCTGNYYRSRFAEILFNVLAGQAGLPWQATSRGIATERGIGNNGPISAYALQGLFDRGIALPPPLRFPQQLRAEDLEGASLVIALREAEHRPLLTERFPAWANRAEYWQIHDLDGWPAEEALPEIERQVRALIARLSASGEGGPR